MKIGIDAGELLTERRGKARYLQSILAALPGHTDIHATLLCEPQLADVTKTRYARSNISVADTKSAKGNEFDVVWYPWNTLHFATQSPTVATIHDVFAFTTPAKNFFSRRREQKALIQTARETSEIIACSDWSRLLISETLDVDENSITAVSPMPDGSWHPAPDPLPFLELTDMPYVLILPGFRGEQNFEFFLDVFSRATKKRDIRLVVCGELPLSGQKAFGKIPHTSILAPDDNELRSLYRNAAAVAVPATQEAYSFTAAEASACGAVVLAADAGALPEVVGDCAVILKANDRKVWVAALHETLFDQTYNTKLRARAASHWNAVSRSGYVDEILTVLRRAAIS